MSKRRRTWRPRPALAVRPTPLTLLPVPTGAGTDDHARTESDPTSSPGVDAQQVLMLIATAEAVRVVVTGIPAGYRRRHCGRTAARAWTTGRTITF